MATNNEKESLDKTDISRFVGQSLFNHKWSNCNWATGQPIYLDSDSSNSSRRSSKASCLSERDSIISSSTSTSRSNSTTRSRNGSRHSSISSSSDQGGSQSSLDARSFVGFGLIRANDGATTTTNASKFLTVPNGKKQQERRNSDLIQYKEFYDAYNSPASPVCQFCNHDFSYYHGCLCRQYAMLSMTSKCDDNNFEDPMRRYPIRKHLSPFNYYNFIMEAAYNNSLNCAISSADYEKAKVKPPPERRWISVQNHNEQRKTALTITSMSYNILCDKYASSNVHSFSPSWCLNWDYRKRTIFQQLQKYDPDVIALQEVETQQYWTFFKPKLAMLGYDGIFSARSRAKTMSHEEKQSVDGCALFWKKDKFELQKEHVIEFTQLAIAKADKSEHMLNRVMTRDNIALAAVLRIKQDGESGDISESQLVPAPLIACSAHIHWDPEFCDVKLIQTMMLVQELTSIVDQVSLDYDVSIDDVPLLLCGDLNSTEDSSVYEFLTMGSIEADHEDFKDFRGQTCLQNLSSANIPDTYCHDLLLRSAYEPGTMPFTNFSYDFKGVIDYIFSSPNMICQSVVGAVDTAWFRENEICTCPCPYIPSDHLPLVARHAIVLPMGYESNAVESESYDTGC